MKTLMSRRFLLLGLAAGYSVLAFARTDAAHADFSGRWRMVKDKCDFGGFSVPDMIVRQIEQKNTTLNVHTVQTKAGKTTTADVSYFTDGTEASNVISGREATSKAFWDGTALMVRTNTKDSKGDDLIIEDRWELSDDKQTLTNTSHITTDKGSEVTMKLVCSREEVGK